MRWLRRHRLELAWAAFVCVNAALIWLVEDWETIPFHFIWLSLTLLYFFRPWGLRVTGAVLAAVCVLTGITLGWVVVRGPQGPDELAEVPMMALIYAVMVFHARRGYESIGLQRLVERQRAFVREASHLLRTPITVAQGHVELIQAACNGGQTGEDAQIVLEELGRLSAISDRLLLLASAESSPLIVRQDVEVDRLLHDLARRWTVTAPRRWEVSIAAEGVVTGDRERLMLALDELIENALRATSPGDRISITERAEGTSAVIEIADSGVGIPQKELHRIFDPLSRSTVSRREGGHGAGLGLAIVKAIVEAHDGSIDVESEPGRGATFRIRLDGFRRRTQASAATLVPADLTGTSA